MENDSIIKKTKQLAFNQIKGIIEELNEGDVYSSFTINVGHENKRLVNLICKKEYFLELKKNVAVGNKVIAKFFISSKYKYDKWYTTASVLEIIKL